MEQDISFDLIVTIVNKGHCSKVLEATLEAGAEGGTVISGRGSGIHEKATLLSFTIEPEKDILLTLVPESLTEKVLESIVKAADLNEPGKGVAFVLDVEKTTGINHPVQTDGNENE